MAIDTQVPPWLSRNWSPRETFDPSPWLQQGYERKIQEQTIPLKIQQMALQNQATQAAIEHQGMVNETAGMELHQVLSEQPLMKQWMIDTKGDPKLILTLPTPPVLSQQNQQLILNAKRMASQSEFGKALQLQEVAKTQRVTTLINRGGTLPDPVVDPVTGARTFRDEDLASAESAVDAREQQQRMEQLMLTHAPKPGEGIQETREYADLQERLRTENAGLLESGSGEETPDTVARKERIRKLQDQIDFLNARRNMEEIRVDTPNGPSVSIVRGGQKTPETLTTSEQSRLGEDVQATRNSLRSLSQLNDQINSNVVGAMPTISNLIFDKMLAQIDPGFENSERVKGRRMINITTQQIMGELNRSGRFSNMELKRIEQILPSSGAFGSPAEARDAVAQLSRVLAEKGASAALAMKRTVPPEIMTALAKIDDQDLVQDVRNGFVDANVALEAYRRKHSK